MLRFFVCASLALLLAASLSLAGDKAGKKGQKGQNFAGTVKAVDADKGTLTISVKKKKMFEDKDFTIGDSVKIVAFTGADKKQLSGKSGLKEVKSGDKIRVHADEAGNVVSIQVGDLPKKNKKNKASK